MLKIGQKFGGNLFIDFGEGNSVQDLGDYYHMYAVGLYGLVKCVGT